MKHPDGMGNGMVAHYSGTTLDAQKRYADGVHEILANFFDKKPQTLANLIVENGQYATRVSFLILYCNEPAKSMRVQAYGSDKSVKS